MGDRICSICRGATALGCEFCNPTLGASVTHGGGSVVVAEASWRELQTELASHKKKVKELEADLEELQSKVKDGFQGGCWCCESVAMKNTELQEKLDRGRKLLPRWREGDFDLAPYVKGNMDGCHQCADELERALK